MFTAQPLSRQYCTWAVICASVRSGRKEKQPWVMRMSVPPSNRHAGGWDEIGRVGRFVIERDVLPDLERLAQRRAGLRRLGQDLRTLMDVVAALVAREDHRFQRHPIGGRAGLDAPGMSDGAAAELQHDVFAEQVEQLM